MQDAPQPRRRFLSDLGSGFAGVALAGMLQRDGLLGAETGEWSPPDGKPHFAPKAKSVIWLFMAARSALCIRRFAGHRWQVVGAER